MTESGSRETEMHTLYLSDTTWGELKRRAVMERSNASQITDYVLRSFLQFQPAIDLPRRRSRSAIQERLNRRNLHLEKETWEQVASVAQARKYSISVLTEFLLRKYLGLEITDDLRIGGSEREPPRTERVPANQIPKGLWPHFQEYDPVRLDLESDADLVIQRTLESGTWEEVRWLFETYGSQRIRLFLVERGERLLTQVAFNYWRKLLGVKKWRSSPFLTSKGELWTR